MSHVTSTSVSVDNGWPEGRTTLHSQPRQAAHACTGLHVSHLRLKPYPGFLGEETEFEIFHNILPLRGRGR